MRVGEGYLLNNMSESPRGGKYIYIFFSLCSYWRVGLHTFLRDKTHCSVIMLGRLLLCNFTPKDRQIKTFYLGRWSAIRQEIWSFSLHKRMISESLPRFVKPMNLFGWWGAMDKWTDPTGLSWVKDQQRWRMTDNLALCHCKRLGQWADHSWTELDKVDKTLCGFKWDYSHNPLDLHTLISSHNPSPH